MTRAPVLSLVIALVAPLFGLGCGGGDTLGPPDPARDETAIPYTERAGRGPEAPGVGAERPASDPERADFAGDVADLALFEATELPERDPPNDR